MVIFIIVGAVLLMFICGQIYLKKLRMEVEKSAAEISVPEGENFEIEHIVKTYKNEAQYQKKRSRLYLQMIFFAGVLSVFGFGLYIYQKYGISFENINLEMHWWENIKNNLLQMPKQIMLFMKNFGKSVPENFRWMIFHLFLILVLIAYALSLLFIVVGIKKKFYVWMYFILLMLIVWVCLSINII